MCNALADAHQRRDIPPVVFACLIAPGSGQQHQRLNWIFSLGKIRLSSDRWINSHWRDCTRYAKTSGCEFQTKIEKRILTNKRTMSKHHYRICHLREAQRVPSGRRMLTRIWTDTFNSNALRPNRHLPPWEDLSQDSTHPPIGQH